MTLLFDGRRLQADVTAEVPVACYPDGQAPDPERVAGIDLGIIHPYAVAGPDGQGLLVSGRAVRAECRLHLRDSKARTRAAARRAPKPGQRGSRRWRQHRRSQRAAEARHARRVRQAQHEAARSVVDWAVKQRAGTLIVGDPRGVLQLAAGRVHGKRLRDWRIGHLMSVLRDKAEAAGITVTVTDERGTSSTCPSCSRRVPKPAGRVFRCPHCGHGGHRDLVAAANIAARGGGPIPATEIAGITHRRAGGTCQVPGCRDVTPGAGPHHGQRPGVSGRHRPAPHTTRWTGSRSPNPRGARKNVTPDELTSRCTKSAGRSHASTGRRPGAAHPGRA